MSHLISRIKQRIKLEKGKLSKLLRKFKPVAKTEELVQQLRASGIKNGDILMVHGSLSKLGNIDGGAKGIIEALQLSIGTEGTLVMPAFSYINSMMNTVSEENYVFRPATTPSVVGIIPETFRKTPNVKRSIHPTHSVCAWGAEADELVTGHFEANSNFGLGTPFHKVLKNSGKIAGLGISIGPVTIYHCLEDLYPELFKSVYLPNSYTLNVEFEHKVTPKEVRIHDPFYHRNRIDKTEKIEAWFTNHLRSKNILHEGIFAQGNMWWMDVNELFSELLVLKEKGISIYSTPEK